MIFNKNDSYRISQYDMGCDIVIFNWKGKSNKDIIFGCTLFFMWYCDILTNKQVWISQYHTGCDIVIFNQNGFTRISQYHNDCDIEIFYKNGSDRISQFHMGCDIVIFNWKSESNKDIILGFILFLMWYCDIVIF